MLSCFRYKYACDREFYENEVSRNSVFPQLRHIQHGHCKDPRKSPKYTLMLRITVLCVYFSYLSVGLVTSLWHPYESTKIYDAECLHDSTQFKNKTRSVAQESKDKWRLWPNVVSRRDLEDGETMYGFEEGMEAIWKNQHPEDCANAKYLISGGFEIGGFGAEFHLLGEGLAVAMNMNRVYVMFSDGQSQLTSKMDSNNRFQVDIDFCKKQGKSRLDCYYEPWVVVHH